MNNGESSDVNVVLAHFLGIRRHDGLVSVERAKAAAVRLADRAYKQLSAGTRGEDIAAAFDQRAAMVEVVGAAVDEWIEEQAAAGDELAVKLRRTPAEPVNETGPGVSIQ
ncbi:hypothetical protein BBK82_05145 [Lentzea guizhouensis]|uniref:Uncharacterized protein n=1 Tax=Lentzea guizhouensis TaxID=1586287 RepID=A0A1B2HCX7_9PSEU|nr:hypothetical protein [Lentzea guizhouensis]ANZ35559.1 hypothetical protein BBK82_05145 [Lentzea guizhouensis]